MVVEEIRERIIRIVENYVTEPEAMDLVSGLDSVDFISMMVEIEEEFDIILPDDFLNGLTVNMDSICNYIWDNKKHGDSQLPDKLLSDL